MWMLKRDNEIRLSSETQQKYLENVVPNDQIPIIDEIQKRVANDALINFGYAVSDRSIQRCISILNKSLILFPNDPDIRNSAHYLKFNRMLDYKIPLSVGDQIQPQKWKLEFLNEYDCFMFESLIHNNHDEQQTWLMMTGSIS